MTPPRTPSKWERRLARAITSVARRIQAWTEGQRAKDHIKPEEDPRVWTWTCSGAQDGRDTEP